MKPINLSEILRHYEGQWVALDEERTQVLVSGHTIESVITLIKQKAYNNPIITFISRFDTDYVG